MLIRIPIPSRKAPIVTSMLSEVQPRPCLIGVDAPRHTEQAQVMHWEEAQIKPDKHDPEAPFAERLVELASGHLREPVIETRKNREDVGTDQHIMYVPHDVIGVVNLPIDGDDRR